MRSRKRLIDVLRSTNDNVVTLMVCACCLAVADGLEGNHPHQSTVRIATLMLNRTTSPHIAELATEALHYLKEGENNG